MRESVAKKKKKNGRREDDADSGEEEEEGKVRNKKAGREGLVSLGLVSIWLFPACAALLFLPPAASFRAIPCRFMPCRFHAKGGSGRAGRVVVVYMTTSIMKNKQKKSKRH